MNHEFIKKLPIKNIRNIQAVSGGDVNAAYKVETAEDTLFLLVQANSNKDFFLAEAAGLEDFERAGVTAPKVIDIGEIGRDAYLLISYLDEGHGRDYPSLARMIAKLHRYTSESGLFGYDYPHRGAKMTYDNSWTNSWIDLFIERRLDSLRDELLKLGYWTSEDVGRYEKARQVMVYVLDNKEITPSLLHGDLWGGNHMFLKNGDPAIYDPSPFYGDREFDLGVATSFGLYPDEFFEAYHQDFPLEANWQARLAYYRLYVYMNHLHKFGSSYRSRVNQTLQQICQQA